MGTALRLQAVGMVDEEEVRVEVVVPVDPGHAGAHRLREIHVAIGPINLGPV